MDIKYVSREDVDKVKWNSCVHFAANGNIFGYKWYLDCLTKDWGGLIEGDYESVFPVIWATNFWKKKFLYHPLLARELGLFSVNILSPKRLRTFLDKIPPEFGKGVIRLNERNQPIVEWGMRTIDRTNFQLLLNQPYESLAANYQGRMADFERPSGTFKATNNLKPEKIAAFYKQHSVDRRKDKEFKFHALQRIMYNALHRGWGSGSGILDQQGNLQAVNFFLFSHNRAVSLVPVESPAGRRFGALNLLFDLFIQASAGRPLILDFNSSSDRYQDFGAVATRYYELWK